MLIARKSRGYGAADPIAFEDITIGDVISGIWKSLWSTRVSTEVAMNPNYDANNWFWQTDVPVNPKEEVSYVSNF